MSVIETAIEVEVPVRIAYNQWTQFEEFPRFMKGVVQVQQKDNKHLHWKGSMAGKEEEWDAEITEQIPDRRIAWRGSRGAQKGGVVTFAPLSAVKAKVHLRIEYEPEGMIEKAEDAMGVSSYRVEEDLVRFKQFIESRDEEARAA